jgi:DUF3035 family protein
LKVFIKKESTVFKFKLSFFVMSALAFTLTACDKAKEALGLTRSSPDEMQVIERPPLSMPPGYGLRPPLPTQQKGASEPSPREEAQTSLLGNKGNQSLQKSQTESEILKKAKADASDPNIRQTIDSEMNNNKPSIGEQLAFWTDKNQKGKVIDPQEENEKINGSKMPGKPKKQPSEAEPASSED